ncbi:hypothetical protein FQN60_014328 [Etheostoma spectabile]|uniref:Uncharacterized protein n=1 Tax=Etheostoma spectabile TaxID=54343 RepID=A0A5J5DA88_9PERO|nr:hypothetical protein FQN60_014328 [Etheostoma spectabile]
MYLLKLPDHCFIVSYGASALRKQQSRSVYIISPKLTSSISAQKEKLSLTLNMASPAKNQKNVVNLDCASVA